MKKTGGHAQTLHGTGSRTDQEHATEFRRLLREAEFDLTTPGLPRIYATEIDRHPRAAHVELDRSPPVRLCEVPDGNRYLDYAPGPGGGGEIDIETPAHQAFVAGRDHFRGRHHRLSIDDENLKWRRHLLPASEEVAQTAQRGEADRDQEHPQQQHPGESGSEGGGHRASLSSWKVDVNVHSPAMTGSLHRSARNLLLLSGLALLGLTILTMTIRGVDPIEVVATLAFAPIFAAILFFGLRGGAALSMAAVVMYVLLRKPAIDLVGIAPLSGLILGRTLGFLAFGLVGGWAAEVVGGSLTKLALFDEIDDDTGLKNARSLVAVLDRERSRMGRYAGVFSVVHASFVPPPGSARSVRSALRSLGVSLANSVRISDHISHMSEEDRSHIVVVLPETGREGASTVAANLGEILDEWGADNLEIIQTTHPDDDLGDEHPVAKLARRIVAQSG